MTFEECYERHQKLVWWTVRKIGEQYTSSFEDIVQQAWLKVWLAWDRTPADDKAMRTWIYRISLNAARDYLRYTERYLSRNTLLDEQQGEETVADQSEEFYLVYSGEKDAIRDAFSRISDKDQETIRLLIAELSPSEIGTHLGCSKHVLYRRINSARKHFTLAYRG